MISRVLSRTFDVYGQRFVLLVGWTAVIVVPLELALLALQLAAPDTDRARYGLLAIEAIAQVLIVTPLATVLVIRTAQASERGGAPTPRTYLAEGFELLPAMAAVLLAVLLMTVPLALFSVVVGVALAPAGLIVLVAGLVVVVLVATRLSLAIPALVVEGKRGFTATRRSLELVRGATGRVLATVLVLGVIAAIIGAIAGGALGLLHGSRVADALGQRLAEALSGSLTAPILALGQYALLHERTAAATEAS